MERHFDHQSLALLAGVAVDKGPESEGTYTSTTHHTIPHHYVNDDVKPTLVNDTVSQSHYNIMSTCHPLIQFPVHHQQSCHTTTLPINIEMAPGTILEDGHTEVVEVQYIIDPSAEFHVTGDVHGSNIVIDHIHADDNLVEIEESKIHVISGSPSQIIEVEEQTVTVEDHIAQEEVISSLVVDEEIINMQINEMISADSSLENSDEFKSTSSELNDSVVKIDGEFLDPSVRRCFLCHRIDSKCRDLFDSESKKLMLPQLLNRHMSISVVPKYNSKNDYSVCEECVQMFLRWHDVSTKYHEKRNNESATSSAVDLSEDDNSQDDQQQPTGSKKSRGKYQKRIGTRKYRYALLQSQIKNLIFNSPFHYLIKREITEDDWEYIAERLHSTKSNSSAKVKEIETLTFGNEKLVSVFCDDCRKSIPGGKEGYYGHRKEIHSDNEDMTLPCDICGNFYPEKDSTGLSHNYFPHWINHFYFEECQECKEKFPNPSLLKKHKVTHQERPGFPCPKCDKVLAKKITLEQHIKTHLPVEEKKKNALTCHLCGKIITAPTLKAHMFSVHSDERPWKCEVCGAKFKHKSDLGGHRNAVHLKIKNYNCTICGKSFGHHCGLRVHMMKHENKREHCCTTCGKKFITQWHLKKHTVTHKAEKDVICGSCGKGFKKVEALQEHMTIHTGEMPHECHICGRRVRVLSNLYKHYMVHKRNKTYYSKKDGLPDPLDAYIVEQQKKKQVNKIVEENQATRASALEKENPDNVSASEESTVSHIVEVTSTSNIRGSMRSLNIDEPELKVNRSTNRITYPGPTSSTPVTLELKGGKKRKKSTPDSTSSTNADVRTSRRKRVNILESDSSVVASSAVIPIQTDLGDNRVYVTNSDGNYSVQLPDGQIAIVQPSQIVYKVVDENGIEIETTTADMPH